MGMVTLNHQGEGSIPSSEANERISMAKTKVLRVPYDDKGNLLHYPHGNYGTRPDGTFGYIDAVWQPNELIRSKILQFEYMSRGRSAAYAVFKDPEGHTYPMFMSDLGDLLVTHIIRRGVVQSDWMVAKKGSNYGIRLAKSDEIDF